MVKLSLQFVLMSAVLLTCPIAGAQPDASTYNNGTPAWGGPGGRHQGGWNGQYRHGRIPTREQVMSLSTLSPSQRQDIEGIYQQAHETVRPLIAQLRQLGGGEPGGNNAPDSDAGGNPQKADLMRQIREQRRSTWEAVKAKLTPDQITQLQQQVAAGQAQSRPNQ